MQNDIYTSLNADETHFLVRDRNSNTVVMADKILSVGNVFKRLIVGRPYLDLRFTSGEAVRFVASHQQLIRLKIVLLAAVENNARKLKRKVP